MTTITISDSIAQQFHQIMKANKSKNESEFLHFLCTYFEKTRSIPEVELNEQLGKEVIEAKIGHKKGEYTTHDSVDDFIKSLNV